MGPSAVPAAAAIAAAFTKNDRLANGCGIPSELRMLRNSKEIRSELGLNAFRSSVNTFRHYPDGTIDGEGARPNGRKVYKIPTPSCQVEIGDVNNGSVEDTCLHIACVCTRYRMDHRNASVGFYLLI